MAEYFTVTEQQIEAAAPEALIAVLTVNAKLKNNAVLDEILGRKCPAGKQMTFQVNIGCIEIIDV